MGSRQPARQTDRQSVGQSYCINPGRESSETRGANSRQDGAVVDALLLLPAAIRIGYDEKYYPETLATFTRRQRSRHTQTHTHTHEHADAHAHIDKTLWPQSNCV